MCRGPARCHHGLQSPWVDHLRRLGGNSALLSGPLAVDSDSRFESLCAARDVDAEVAAVLTDLIAVALGDTLSKIVSPHFTLFGIQGTVNFEAEWERLMTQMVQW